MKRIFITGMSGTGKSSVIEELRSRGFTAIDTDYDDWCELAILNGESERVWREDRMRHLLTTPLTSPLFVSGCYSNQRNFYPYFDAKVLFSAPLEVMLERVMTRSSNPYGRSDEDRAAIRQNYKQVQPLLKKSADFEIDSSVMDVNEIADFLVQLASDKI
jgi:dephospho-CoA kinase